MSNKRAKLNRKPFHRESNLIEIRDYSITNETKRKERMKIRRRENIRSRERRRSFSQALEPNEHSLVFRRGKNRAKIVERFGTAARANGNFTIVDHSSKSLSPRGFHRALYSGYRRCQQYFDPPPLPLVIFPRP